MTEEITKRMRKILLLGGINIVITAEDSGIDVDPNNRPDDFEEQLFQYAFHRGTEVTIKLKEHLDSGKPILLLYSKNGVSVLQTYMNCDDIDFGA